MAVAWIRMSDEKTEERTNGRKRTGKRLRQDYARNCNLFALTLYVETFYTHRTRCGACCAVVTQVGSNLVVSV
jgi:hypothetical protein